MEKNVFPTAQHSFTTVDLYLAVGTWEIFPVHVGVLMGYAHHACLLYVTILLKFHE